MKPRTVILLWAIAAVLGIAAYFVKFHSSDDNNIHTQLSPGEKILPGLAIQDLSSVTLHQGPDSTTLTRGKDNNWTVNERANYPANHELLRNLLGALGELQVTQGYPCTSEHFGRFGVANESQEESDLGLRVTMADAQGKSLAEVFLGKYNGTNKNAMGRFIRNSRDDSGVYATGETFPGVYADAPIWLDQQFFKIENIQSVGLSAPNDSDFKAWEVARASSALNAQFKLVGITDQEMMKLTSTSTLRRLWAHSSFQDVLSDAEAQTSAHPDTKLKRQATIKTFDGITYTITFWPQQTKPQPAADPDSPLPPVQAAYLLTVAVSADLPTSRLQSPDEKPEDVKQRDAAFKVRQQQLKDSIKLTQSFQERIYQVGHTMLEPLQKSRSDFVSKKQSPPKQ